MLISISVDHQTWTLDRRTVDLDVDVDVDLRVDLD